jgi:hypothetical protein
MLYRPKFAELLFSRRRYILQGRVPDEDRQLQAARPHMTEVWESDYATRIVREAGLGIATSFHAAKLLGDKEFTSVLSAFLTSPKGQSLQEARHEEQRFQPLTTLLPSESRKLAR